MWATVAATAGILLAVAAWVWYKVRVGDDARVQSAQVDLLAAQARTSQEQALKVAREQQAALKAEAKKVLSVQDPEARKQAALALLHRVRGKL